MSALALRILLTAAACLVAWAAWEAAQRVPLGPLGPLGDLRALAGLALVFLALTVADRLWARLRGGPPAAGGDAG